MNDGESVMLIKVDPRHNNNKFYKITQTGDKIVCSYGRISERSASVTYPLARFTSLYRSKLKKGYEDHTELYIVEEHEVEEHEVEAPVVIKRDPIVQEFIDYLEAISRHVAQAALSVDLNSVTPKQVEASKQQLLNIVTARAVSVDEANQELVKQFAIIPRYINRASGVKGSLFTGDKEYDDGILNHEYELLEQLQTIAGKHIISKTREERFELALSDNKEVSELFYDGLIGQYDHAKIISIFSATNPVAETQFNDLGNNHLFWHGSKSENWESILSNNLMVRPQGVTTTGAMFGHGLYMAEVSQKSIGYTNGGFWAGGTSERFNIIGLYETSLGNVEINELGRGSIEQSVSKGYDSLWAYGRQKNKRSSLWNDEIILPNGNQTRIKYVIKFKL